MAPLAEYKKKRNFSATPEPKGHAQKSKTPIFVIQRHAARRLHFDFRLEIDRALASWAVPKGPPEEPGEKRLAVHVEDHPLDYAKFEGTIPKGNYGAGDVQIWDRGTFEVEGDMSASDQVKRGDLKFVLHGERLTGRFALVQMRRSENGKDWLLIRKKEELAGVTAGKPVVRGAPTHKADAQADLPGALKAAMPGKLAVTLATLAEKPFSDPAWLYEIKWDGERALAFIRDGEVELRARSDRDITGEYPELKELAKRMVARKAILDGEIVVLDESGRSNFSRIQQRFGVVKPSAALQQSSPVTYYAFDLLYCDGYDLRQAALEQRKELLRKLLTPSERVRFSDHQVENGVELFEVAKKQQLEGIIAKRRDSPYVGRRTPLWLKFKIVQDMDIVIGGWTAPRKSREHFGALLMGLYNEKGDLEYIGSVGTGFDRTTLDLTFQTLARLETQKCPFAKPPKTKEEAHWVKPEMVARVKYGQWTVDKMLRAPVFLGFQEDRSARDCKFEEVMGEMDGDGDGAAKESRASDKGKRRGQAPALHKNASKVAASKHASASQSKAHAGKKAEASADSGDLENELANGKSESLNLDVDGKRLNLTHLNKVLFPPPKLHKRDILLYYSRIAPHILPFLKDRPLVLKRYPNGIDHQFFFQKEAKNAPEWIKTVMIDSEERGGKMPYFVAEDRADLLYLTNLGCIDHNPWSSRYDDELHPDYVFIDLDPTEGTAFDTVLKVARSVNKNLTALGMKAYLKTSGATGFHVYVPLEREYTYEEVRMFAGAIGQRVQSELPEAVTFERTVRKRRKGTVLIDALQNAHGKPLAAVYSLRPQRGAPVSAPVSPRELEKNFKPSDFNIETIFARLNKMGDLWGDFWKNRQNLQEAAAKA